MRIKKTLILFCVVLAISLIFSTPSHAGYFKLKNPPSEVKLYTYQDKGRYFDNDYTKKNPPENDAGRDKRSNGLIELSAWASSWIRASEASIRGIDYRDFEIKADLPEGSKVKCSLDVSFEYGGYVNTASSGSARGYFLIQMDMGFLTPNNLEAWNHPAIGKTVYKKSNFKTWFEKVIDLTNQTAGDQLQDIATAPIGEIFGPVGEVAMLVVNAVQQLCEYGEDALTVDLVTSGELGGTYQNLWLTIDTQYRTFLTLQLCAQAEAPSQSITDNFSYICFYDQSPVKGIDFRSALPRKGFGIKKVELVYYDKDNIAVPDTYVCSVIDINKFSPKNTGKLEAGKPEPFEVVFVNKGKKASSGCRAVIETTNDTGTVSVDIPAMDPGEKWTYSFEHKFRELGKCVFTVTIDPDKKLDRLVDLTKKKVYEFSANYEHVPMYDVKFVESSISVSRKDNAEAFQSQKPLILKGRIKNSGEISCEKAVVSMTGANKILESTDTEIIRLAPGEEHEFSFEFLSGGSDLHLQITAEPKGKDSDASNNYCKFKIGPVERSEVIWCVKKEDFSMNPEYPTENRPVTFKVAVTNGGNAIGEQVKGGVYIFDHEKKSTEKLADLELTDVRAGERVFVEDLKWKPKGLGWYSFEVRFDKDSTKASSVKRENFKQAFQVGIEMDRVSGTDVLIRDSDVRYDEEKEMLYYTVYNRGLEDVLVTAHLYVLFGDGTAVPYYHYKVDHQRFLLRAQRRYDGTFGAVTSGNFRYKIVIQPIDKSENPIGVDKDMGNNEVVYTCKEFTPGKIGPDLAITGVSVRITKNKLSESALASARKYLYVDNDGCVYSIVFGISAANIGNMPCPATKFESMVLDAGRPDLIPEFKEPPGAYGDQYAYISVEDFHRFPPFTKPVPIHRKGYAGSPTPELVCKSVISMGSVHRAPPPESDRSYLIINPTPTKQWLFMPNCGHIETGALVKGDYIVKFDIDPDNKAQNDACPENNKVTIRFSVPDFLEKFKSDQYYFFLLSKENWPASIKKMEWLHDQWRKEKRFNIVPIVLQASSEYGFED